MLQESTQAAAATGGNAAAALTQMGVDHLLSEMTANPGAYAVSWAVLLTLLAMSAMSISWIVINFFKNIAIAGGFLVLAAHGAGKFSVDGLIAARRAKAGA